MNTTINSNSNSNVNSNMNANANAKANANGNVPETHAMDTNMDMNTNADMDANTDRSGCVSPLNFPNAFGTITANEEKQQQQHAQQYAQQHAQQQQQDHHLVESQEVVLHNFGAEDFNLWSTAVPEDLLEVQHLHLHTFGNLVQHKHQNHHHHHHRHQEEQSENENDNQYDNDNDEAEQEDEEMAENYQGHRKHNQKHNVNSKNTSSHDHNSSITCTCFSYIKYILSTLLLLFCLGMVAASVVTRQTKATSSGVHPALALLLACFLITWLSLMEGGLNCMVGLKPITKSLYAITHPKTKRCTTLAHRGDNLERFIVGRQFLDLSCIFLTNYLVTSNAGANVLGLPQIVNDIFLGSGLAITLITIVFGQLTSVINAAHCMLDFINNYAMAISTWLAITLEASGLLHAVYLVQIIFSKVTRKPIKSNEPHKSAFKRTLFWTKITISTSLVILSAVLIFTAIAQDRTSMWTSVPSYANFLLLVGLILLTGLMEGLQIAFFAVVHLPEDTIKHNKVAYKNCKYIFKPESNHLQTFLVGRQIFQTIVMVSYKLKST